MSSGEDLNVNQITSSKSGKTKLFGHCSTVWSIETLKCVVSLDSGRAVDMAEQKGKPNWNGLISADVLALGSEDGLIRVFLRPREFANSKMLALDSAFHQEVYNKVA